MDRIRNYLEQHQNLGIQLPNEASTSAYERYATIKREKFKRRLLQEIKESARTRAKLVKLQESIEKLAASSRTVEDEISGLKLKNKKKSLKNRGEALKREEPFVPGGKISSKKSTARMPEDGQFSSVSNGVLEEEVPFSVSGLPEEEARAALWKHISRKQIPKLVRAIHQGTAARLFNCKKLAHAASGLVKRQHGRLASKPVTAARRSMKEMLAFWKRNEREERDLRKRAEKEAAERRKIEEEQREARRQAKKLNFLITQTELYSHFVGRKQQQDGAPSASPVVPLAKDVDFADVDDSVIHAEAERIARNAAVAHQAKLEQFNTNPKTKEDMDFMNPSTLKDATILEQPALMQVTLKSYQLKGLTWLASLYEQVRRGYLYLLYLSYFSCLGN